METLSFDGQQIAYFKSGTGPAIVIVHGIGGHKEDFKAVADDLAARGYMVLAFDMLGFGGSSRDATSVSITTQAKGIGALLDHEKIERAHLAGNSLGGWVATTFATLHPQRVLTLTLIDPAGLRVTMGGPPPVNFAPDTVAEMHALLSVVIASPFAHTDEFAAQALAQFKAGGEAATLGKLFTGFASPENEDKLLDDLLPLITVPTQVVWGAKDGLFPVALADMVTGGLRNAKKIILPDASHFPQIDDPAGLSAAIAGFAK